MYTRPPQLKRPVFDAQHGVVPSSMQPGVRVTCGTALEGWRRIPDVRQLSRAAKGLRAYMDLDRAEPGALWHSTRPFLTDMLPTAGQATRQDRIWFHFGHSHQGVTLGPATACRLADMMGAGQARPQVP
ncbi:FAD-dependent oxidoreductase [Leisingera aquaemixtae]|uniref:FAD-dependent oxidoreductase n=1 Tax=Leisingera aquaemixtae TaxID=1396826 RepID=UPI0022025358|nr:FAD-dependent oxidoreductase [Leisingera aquaemixtae]UWQ36610.1 FAD-dependent oxidoreductase [Leisingera aquaemixtae]